MSSNSEASSVVELPVPKISQSLNIKKDDLKGKKQDKKSKTKKHKHIDLYFDKQFLEDYFKP
tara:strand:+ start:834 stop:1019 length:186 start_codon:yes stop_codon:yes gene_type:complete